MSAPIDIVKQLRHKSKCMRERAETDGKDPSKVSQLLSVYEHGEADLFAGAAAEIEALRAARFSDIRDAYAAGYEAGHEVGTYLRPEDVNASWINSETKRTALDAARGKDAE